MCVRVCVCVCVCVRVRVCVWVYVALTRGVGGAVVHTWQLQYAYTGHQIHRTHTQHTHICAHRTVDTSFDILW